MTRWLLSSRTKARLALLPWLSLGFVLTGCPLQDHYRLDSGAIGGGTSDDGGAGAASLGGAAAAPDAGPDGTAEIAGNGGNTGASSGSAGWGEAGSAEAGSLGTSGEAGQGQTGSGGATGSGGNASLGGSSAVSGGGGNSGSTSMAGSGGLAGSGDYAGTASAGAAGSAGGSSCSALTCGGTCCAASGGCVDTSRDFRNCGSCGLVCSMGRSCNSSTCTPGWVSMSPPAPGFVARWRAASVAMGGSVFIWGGSDSAGGVLDSGAIYSPMTDTWTPVAKDTYTPTARVLATAVWTGSVVVVFGGSDASGATPYNNGALYDPAKNAWRAMPNASKARAASLGFWDGKQAIFHGGIGATAAAVAGAERFDLTTWSTSSVTGDPGAVLNPAYAFDGSVLYLEGGQVAGARTDRVFSYTSNTDAWTMLSKSLSGRTNAFGVWDGARFLVWGGQDNFGLRSDGKYLGPSAVWSTVSTTNAPTARMAVPRRSGWIFETSPGLIALFGGETSTFGNGTFATTGFTYDTLAAKWAATAAFPSGETHDYGVGVWTGAELVLWGGRTGAALTPTVTGERWKP